MKNWINKILKTTALRFNKDLKFKGADKLKRKRKRAKMAYK